MRSVCTKHFRIKCIFLCKCNALREVNYGSKLSFMVSLESPFLNIMFVIFWRQFIPSMNSIKLFIETLSLKMCCLLVSTKLNWSTSEQPKICQDLISQVRETDLREGLRFITMWERLIIWLLNASTTKHLKKYQMFIHWVAFFTF